MPSDSPSPRRARHHSALGSDHPAARAVVARGSRRELTELALVLTAVGIPHATVTDSRQLLLVVHPEDAVRADEELQRYRVENRHVAPRRAPERRPLAQAWPGSLVFGLILGMLYLAQSRGAHGLDWTAAGRTSAAAIRDGEVWRTLTALTLHGDVPHLIGNVIFGALFGGLLAQLLGNGVAWAAVLASGAVGNLLNGLVQRDTHTSLGASTAVFGALGLIVALSWCWRATLVSNRLQRWAPVVMGIALLGYLGTAGERTDVLAHVFGFVAGAGIGLALSRRSAPAPAGLGVQRLAGAGALGLLVLAWLRAFGVV